MDQIDETAAWQAAREKYRTALQRRQAWKAANPEPHYDDDTIDYSAVDAAHAIWEQGVVLVDGDLDSARDALIEMQAPSVGALILKLAFVREGLDGWGLGEDIMSNLAAIERDILHLAARQGEPAPTYPETIAR